MMSFSIAVMALVFLANPRQRILPVVDAGAAPATLDGARLHVLTYNVFVRPEPVSFGDETTCRSGRIGAWLAEESHADIVVLTETFLAPDVKLLTHNAAGRFPHQLVGLPKSDDLLGVSGGLSILSRYPIEQHRVEVFDECSGAFDDCLATKGVLSAVVRIDDDRRVNVVATHLDAGRGAGDREARRAQLRQVRAHMDRWVDPRLPTILMGDFNVDGLPVGHAMQGEEYDEMLGTLARAATPPVDAVRETAPRWSLDPLVTRLYNTLNCETTIWCDEDSPNERAERRRRLDYVFWYDSPAHTGNVVAAEHLPMADSSCGGRWLSDHKAVRATIELE